MNRFDIVVSNYKKLDCFVDNFPRIQNFDGQRDRVYIFDCSPDQDWQEQLAVADRLTFWGLRWGHNLYFIRRRNWGDNWGAQLDYFRCIQDQKISKPQYAAFMQEHYLDLGRYVKEDTIPEDAAYDLDQIETRFQFDTAIGCVFFSRYGIRVRATNPVLDRKKEFFGDGEELLPGARRRGFCVDGGNFVVRPQLYLNWFDSHPYYLTQGDGSYPFCIVWEARMGQILYDQEIKWADMYRNLEFSTIEQLDEIEVSRAEKVSMLWYDNRVWFFFYGRDLESYPPKPLISVLRYYLRHYLRRLVLHSRMTRLAFVQPSGLESILSDEVKI